MYKTHTTWFDHGFACTFAEELATRYYNDKYHLVGENKLGSVHTQLPLLQAMGSANSEYWKEQYANSQNPVNDYTWKLRQWPHGAEKTLTATHPSCL